MKTKLTASEQNKYMVDVIKDLIKKQKNATGVISMIAYLFAIGDMGNENPTAEQSKMYETIIAHLETHSYDPAHN